jgi:hypothetical protein
MKFPVFSLHNREWAPETSSLVTRPSTGESAANLTSLIMLGTLGLIPLTTA